MPLAARPGMQLFTSTSIGCAQTADQGVGLLATLLWHSRPACLELMQCDGIDIMLELLYGAEGMCAPLTGSGTRPTTAPCSMRRCWPACWRKWTMPATCFCAPMGSAPSHPSSAAAPTSRPVVVQYRPYSCAAQVLAVVAMTVWNVAHADATVQQTAVDAGLVELLVDRCRRTRHPDALSLCVCVFTECGGLMQCSVAGTLGALAAHPYARALLLELDGIGVLIARSAALPPPTHRCHMLHAMRLCGAGINRV